MNLNQLVMQRIRTLESGSSGIIRFPKVFYKLCSSLQLPKKQAWQLLFDLQKTGYIEIVPYQGVRVKKIAD